MPAVDITRNGMPNLAHLAQDRTARRLLHALVDGPDPPISSLLNNLGRLTDRSLALYDQASQGIDEWLASADNDQVMALFPVVSTLEELVTCAHRATCFARKAAKLGDIDQQRLPSTSDIRALEGMRNAILHNDSRILGEDSRRPAIDEGEPIFLFPFTDGVELGHESLSYAALGRVLTALHGLLD